MAGKSEDSQPCQASGKMEALRVWIPNVSARLLIDFIYRVLTIFHARLLGITHSCFIRYDAFAYGYALAIVEMPYLFVQSLLFVPIMYWMVSFQARCWVGREVQAISLRSWEVLASIPGGFSAALTNTFTKTHNFCHAASLPPPSGHRRGLLPLLHHVLRDGVLLHDLRPVPGLRHAQCGCGAGRGRHVQLPIQHLQ